MARPQNGVNGNLQQHYGMVYMNAGMQRPPHQNVYGYENIPQVMTNPYGQAYPTSLSHNQILTAQTPGQFVMPYSPTYSMPQYNQFQYSNYIAPQIHQSFTPDVSQPSTISAAPISNPPNPRKFRPLTVVDPNSNTDVDLSKFNLNKKNSMTSSLSLIDKAELEKTEKITSVEKGENLNEVISETKSEKLKENVQSSNFENLKIQAEKEIEQIATSSNSEDEIHNESDVPTPAPDYNLKINKKESDETTLKRKLTYDREYLISLKNSIKINVKPKNMPSTSEFSEDIILKEPNNIATDRIQSSHPDGNKIKNRNAPQKQYSQSYPRKNRNQDRNQERKTINLSIPDSAPLLRSKSGFLPPHLRIKEKETDHMIELKRNIKGNLNKITPQNFQECFGEISKLQIKEPEDMSCLINEIFVKAVKEEAYSVTYAQFCNKLAGEFGNQAFKSELLKKCQDMFQTPLLEQLAAVRTEWEYKIDNENDAKIKLLYENDLEEQVKKAKDNYFGNIRFIGELFLHHLLAGKVILNCIMELLKGSEDADSMLALCKLLETCGKQIDVRHKEHMNNFMRQMNDFCNNKTLETRIRFKLRDIIDMRDRDWTLRHIQQEKKIRPKTIEEQRIEDAVEAATKAAVAANQQQNSKKPPTQASNPNVRRNMAQNMTQRTFQVKNLSCAGHVVDEKTVLGPCRNWTDGSGAKAQKPKDSDGWTQAPTKSRNPNLRLTSNSRSREQSPQSKVKNRYRNLESSAEASGPDSRSSTPPISLPATISKKFSVPMPDTVMSDEDRADLIFKDLLTKNYFNDDSWRQIDDVPTVVARYIDAMMEKDENCRQVVGDNFARLLFENMLTFDQIVVGTQLFVSSIDDVIYDVPKLWEFFAQFFERFIRDKSSNIEFFQDIFKEILPNNDVAQCLSMCLHAASSRLGHNTVGQVFHRSGLNWQSLLVPGPLQWEAFVRTNYLEFTVAGGAPLSPSGGYPLQEVARELDAMLSQPHTNEDVFDYLEKHLDKPTWKSSQCTRTITGCILNTLKSKSASTRREFMKEKKEIIKRISHNKFDNQYEILLSILDLASDLNRDILTIIYDVLATDSIIPTTVFNHHLSDESVKSHKFFKTIESIIHQLHLDETNSR